MDIAWCGPLEKSNLSGFQTFPCIGTGRSCPMRGFAWTRGMGDGLLGTAHTPCHLKRVYERMPTSFSFVEGLGVCSKGLFK